MPGDEQGGGQLRLAGDEGPRRLANVTVEEFKRSPKLQRELYEQAKAWWEKQDTLSKAVLEETGVEARDLYGGLKRKDFDEFVDVVITKCEKNKFEYVTEMVDIVRGRFDLASYEDVVKVVNALRGQDQFIEHTYKGPQVRQGVEYGYPRHHVILEDPTTGLLHEWQIGTRATTEFFETEGIVIPGGMKLKPGMKANIHDIEYVIFKGIQDRHPELAEPLGIPGYRRDVALLAAETGLRGDAVEFGSRLAQLHLEASDILQRLYTNRSQKFIEQFYH